MNEKILKRKMVELEKKEKKNVRQGILLPTLVFYVPLTIILFIISICNGSLDGFIQKEVLLTVVFVLGYFVITTGMCAEFRCLKTRKCNYGYARVTNKKTVDERVEFVGDENERRYFGKEYLLLLDDDDYFTSAKSWTYGDIEVGEKYLFAFTGKKRTRKSIIVCAIKEEI